MLLSCDLIHSLHLAVQHFALLLQLEHRMEEHSMLHLQQQREHVAIAQQ